MGPAGAACVSYSKAASHQDHAAQGVEAPDITACVPRARQAWPDGGASPEQCPLGNMFMEGPPMPAARSGSTFGTSKPAVRYLWVQYRFMGCRQLKPRQPAVQRQKRLKPEVQTAGRILAQAASKPALCTEASMVLAFQWKVTGAVTKQNQSRQCRSRLLLACTCGAAAEARDSTARADLRGLQRGHTEYMSSSSMARACSAALSPARSPARRCVNW